MRKCKTCLGIGFTLKGICNECKGYNYSEYTKEIKYKSSDKQIILKNESNETADCIPGDIIINILCKDSDYKIINNYDLLYYFESKKLISEINFLDNKKYKINILKTNDNTIYKIKDKGLLKKDNNRGDLFIHVLNNINYSDTNILE